MMDKYLHGAENTT